MRCHSAQGGAVPRDKSCHNGIGDCGRAASRRTGHTTSGIPRDDNRGHVGCHETVADPAVGAGLRARWSAASIRREPERSADPDFVTTDDSRSSAPSPQLQPKQDEDDDHARPQFRGDSTPPVRRRHKERDMNLQTLPAAVPVTDIERAEDVLRGAAGAWSRRPADGRPPHHTRRTASRNAVTAR